MERSLEGRTAPSIGGAEAVLLAPAFDRPAAGRRRRSARIGLGAGAIFTGLLVHALLTQPTDEGSFDLWAIQMVQRIRWEPLGRWLNYFEQLTDAPGAIWAWFVTIAVFATLRWWLPAFALLSLPLGGLINETIAREIVGRHRPHLDFLRHTSENSQAGAFPSGHVVGAVLLYGFIWYVVGRWIVFAPLRWLIRLACAAVILLTGFDRIWDGAHWPTDVLGGYALGTALVVALILVCDWVEQTASRSALSSTTPSANLPTSPPGIRRIGAAATALLGALLTRHRWLAVRLRAPSPK